MLKEITLECPFCREKARAEFTNPVAYEGECGGCGARFWGQFNGEKSTCKTRWKPNANGKGAAK